MCEFLPSDEVALDNYAAVRGSLPESGIGNPQTALEAAKNMCMMLRERGEAATHAESLRDAADMLNGHRAALDWILSRRASETAQTMTAAELLDMPEPDHKYLVDGILRPGGILLIGGWPGVGKSVAALSLTIALSRGHEWLGRACEPGRVLYLMMPGEGSVEDLRAEFMRMGLTREDDILIEVGLPSADGAAWLAGLVRKHRPATVVLDTLFGLLDVRDGNAYAEVGAALKPILALVRDSGIGLVTLHHHRKEGGSHARGVLGSTKLAGTMDHVLAIEREGDDGDAPRTIETVKHRAGEPMPKSYLERCPETGRVRVAGTVAGAKARAIDEDILHLVESEGGMFTTNEIAQAVTGNRQQILRALPKMVKDGWLHCEKHGRTRRYWLNGSRFQT